MGGGKEFTPILDGFKRIFAWDYRHCPEIVRVRSSGNLEENIMISERNKFKYYRVRVRKGSPKSSRRIDSTLCKVPRNCGREMKSALSRRSVSEIKCARVNPTVNVLSSNKILSDSTYLYFLVVVADKKSTITKNSY